MQYDEENTVSDAFKFLKDLEKQKQTIKNQENFDISAKINSMSLQGEQRPIYQPKNAANKIKDENQVTNIKLLQQKVKSLSIYDDLQ